MSVKLLYSYFKIPWSILHFEWVFYKHRLLFHNALATWKVLIHWGMLDFQIVMYFIWWYWAGPCRASRQKPFCVPHFFDYRKQPSFSLHELLWLPLGGLKQLEGRNGGPRRNNSQEQSWSKVLFPQQKIHTIVSSSYFADTETLSRWKKLMITKGMLPTLK